VSDHHSVNAMKVLNVVIGLFKVSTEFQHAQQLALAITFGSITGRIRRIFCWWAMILQYMMAILVLFVSTSLLLSCQSGVACVLKTLAVFIVIDMDDLAAHFLSIWWTLDFTVKIEVAEARCTPRAGLDSERYLRDPGETANWTAQGEDGSRSINTAPSRVWFLVVPVSLILAEGGFAIWTNNIPLTFIRHGFVSNEAYPEMLVDIPPFTTDGVSNYAKYTVLVLAPLGEPSPVLLWVGLCARPEPKAPDALQVHDAVDGDGNPAIYSGTVQTTAVQGRFWLQKHGFDLRIYKDLVRRKQLYKVHTPYVASFEMPNLQPNGAAYRVYAAAQNPRTKALSPFTVSSATLFTSQCAANCLNCEESGAGLCDKCSLGNRHTADRLCKPCPRQCRICSISDDSCDVGGCVAGHGVSRQGQCISCNVTGCESCDERFGFFNGTCDRCKRGLGFSRKANHTSCRPCAHEHCYCSREGGCDSCSVGYGLVPSDQDGMTCRKCEEGCYDCKTVRDGDCYRCLEGYAPDPENNGRCRPCAVECLNCTKSGLASCDKCKPFHGFSRYYHKCKKCRVPHCEDCSDNLYKCRSCRHGYGLPMCETCGASCAICDNVGHCKVCERGYATIAGASGGKCWSCADNCVSCTKSGPAKCDLCVAGYAIEKATQTCMDPVFLGGRSSIEI